MNNAFYPKPTFTLLTRLILLLLAVITLAACTSGTVVSSSPEETGDSVALTESETERKPEDGGNTVPDTSSAEMPAASTIPEDSPSPSEVPEESMSPIKETEGSYQMTMEKMTKLLSSFTPELIEEEAGLIRKTLASDFYADSYWTKSSLEYTLRMNNSVYACTANAGAWFEKGNNLQTSWGSLVPVLTAKGDFSPEKIIDLNSRMDRHFANAERLSDSTAVFNAHSYAWSQGKTDQGWLEDPTPLMEDPAVLNVDEPGIGDIIVYLKPSQNGGKDRVIHSALVTEVSEKGVTVESKIGQYGVYRHLINELPPEYCYASRRESVNGTTREIAIIHYMIFRLP